MENILWHNYVVCYPEICLKNTQNKKNDIVMLLCRSLWFDWWGGGEGVEGGGMRVGEFM